MNPADILSKHWDFPSVYDSIKPLLFWHTDTAELSKDDIAEDGQKQSQQPLIEGSEKIPVDVSLAGLSITRDSGN